MTLDVTNGCELVRERIRAGDPLDVAPVRAHLEGCAACRELCADDGRLAASLDGFHELPEALEDLFAATKRGIGADSRLGGVRELRTPVRTVIAAVAALVIAVAVAVATPRVDLVVFPAARMGGVLVALAIALAVALALALRPMFRTTRGGAAPVMLVVAAPIVLALLPAAHQAHPASLAGVGSDLVPRAVGCFLFGTACAAPLVVALWVLARDGLRRSAALAGAFVAAGALGNVALQLHCPLTAVIHRVAGHATVAVALALVSGGIWVLRARRRV